VVDGSGATTLSLNFQTATSLDPRITFSRTSNATVVGSNGLIQYAPHNLLTYSEQFDNAAWVKGNITVTPNSIVAPDLSTTADTITGDTVSSTHFTSETLTFSATTYTYSAYLKKGTNNFAQFRFGSGAGGYYANFDLDNGVVGTATTTSSIQAIGNGWYRCSITATLIAATSNIAIVLVSSANAIGAEINTLSTNIYVWGAQLNEGALQPYYSTTVKNLLGYSQNFENAAWTKINSSIAASTVIGPFGFDGGQKLVEDSATNTHLTQQTPTFALGSVYTQSVYAKAGERTFLQLRSTSLATFSASFDLVNGTYSQVTANTVASINSIGNGWFRCSITFTAGATGASAARVAIMQNATTQSYTGDGTSGIYIFGAQLSDSASLDPYSYNPVAAPTSTAYYGPRFDYDPETLAPKGLLIEEQRTNLVLNSDTISTQSVTVTAQAYTLSFYGTGTITLSGTSTGSLVGTGAYPSRVSLTFTPTAGTLTLTVTGSVRYAQLEAGAFPTSYIPTTSATVTRAADNASMVGSNFSSWYNQSAGTIYSQWVLGGDNISANVYNINDTTATNYIRNRYGSAGTANDNAVTVSNIVQQALTATNQVALYAMYKNAMAYKQNDFARSANGTLITGSTGNIPVVSQMNIGGIVGDYLNGHIQSIKYYPTRLPNGTLQGLTA
jgi:hypothetical protein